LEPGIKIWFLESFEIGKISSRDIDQSLEMLGFCKGFVFQGGFYTCLRMHKLFKLSPDKGNVPKGQGVCCLIGK